MKIGIDTLKTLITGAARFKEENGTLIPLRFTEAQEQMYFESDRGFYNKTFSTAGVKAEFFTNSSSLTLTAEASPSSSRYFFAFDVCVDGTLTKTLRSSLQNEDGTVEKCRVLRESVSLGGGEKRVSVFFPWSVAIRLVSLEIDDGCFVIPAPRKYKMLSFGDSITHGYDAQNPSRAYATALATALDADLCNKGIGGEVFRPALAALKDDFIPDVITVAYGTNDWSKTASREIFERDSRQFFTILASLYPNARIIALAPIWRVGIEKVTVLGAFSNIARQLHAIAENIPNMQVIDCIDFLPKTPEIFSDLKIHPSDEGFDHYTKGIVDKLKVES